MPSVKMSCFAAPDKWCFEGETASADANKLVKSLRNVSEFAAIMRPMGGALSVTVTVTRPATRKASRGTRAKG